MKKTLTTFLFSVATVCLSPAAVISTLNFDDSIWTVSKTQDSPDPINTSSVSGGVITATKSGSGGIVHISVSLNSTISTIGFENITLGFVGDANGNLEWPSTGTDGLIVSGNGVSINTNGVVNGTPAETDFDNGSTFPTANFNSDFTFDASVDNSSINSLTFTLSINSNDESLSLSNVQILGDVVPEPSSALLLGLGSLALFTRRKR